MVILPHTGTSECCDTKALCFCKKKKKEWRTGNLLSHERSRAPKHLLVMCSLLIWPHFHSRYSCPFCSRPQYYRNVSCRSRCTCTTQRIDCVLWTVCSWFTCTMWQKRLIQDDTDNTATTTSTSTTCSRKRCLANMIKKHFSFFFYLHFHAFILF